VGPGEADGGGLGVEFLGDVLRYLTSAESWRGSLGIGNLLREHLLMSALALGVAGAVAFPAGLWIGHRRRYEFLVTSIANVGRAVPSLAILAFLVPFSIRLGLGIGFWPTAIALVALAIPPILTNTYVGVQGVDPDTVEAARGMGMTEARVLRRVEVPLAAPLILAGVRIATLQVIATATLAALVGWGGLGRLIVDGFAVRDFVRVFSGALLVALLALLVDAILGWTSRRLAPRTSTSPEGEASQAPPLPAEAQTARPR
jgi:osmoprotectant transport system permease protein